MIKNTPRCPIPTDAIGNGQLPGGSLVDSVSTGSKSTSPSGPVRLSRLNLALFAFGFAPLLIAFFGNLWDRPYYQFFPTALAGAGLLIYQRIQEVSGRQSSGRIAWSVVFLGGSFFVLSVATLLWSPWLASLAALLLMVGLAWWMGGWEWLRAVLPGVVIMLTIIPPPLGQDTQLMLYLRELAVRWSSHLLDTLKVVHFLRGNVIELPQTQLLVEEACSGINSVLFTISACLIYLFWRRRSWWRMMVCLPGVVAGVLLGNVIRITLGGWLAYHQIINILSGWRHELTGLVLVGAYLALIPSLDECLEFLAQPLRNKHAQPMSSPPPAFKPLGQELGARKNSVSGLLVGGAFALLGLAGLVMGLVQHFGSKVPWRMASPSALRAGAIFTMPPEIGLWKRVEAATPGQQVETLGIYSKIWQYEQNGWVAQVALDYPFHGYHDVTLCYHNHGWQVSHQERLSGDGTNSSPPLMAVEMTKEPVSQALLWFSTVDEQGHWLEQSAVKFNLLKSGRLPGTFDGDNITSYRVQVLVTAYGPVPAAEREPARQLFEAARRILVEQLLKQLAPQP